MITTNQLLLAIAIGSIALLATTLFLLPPESPLIPYTVIALLALLAAIVKYTVDNRREPG